MIFSTVMQHPAEPASLLAAEQVPAGMSFVDVKDASRSATATYRTSAEEPVHRWVASWRRRTSWDEKLGLMACTGLSLFLLRTLRLGGGLHWAMALLFGVVWISLTFMAISMGRRIFRRQRIAALPDAIRTADSRLIDPTHITAVFVRELPNLTPRDPTLRAYWVEASMSDGTTTQLAAFNSCEHALFIAHQLEATYDLTPT